ncbi:MAG TPA: hypothetical protein PK450_09020 [Paracoccaceae bacterium]|nr:hypothetical protein [Paracoccaceae bacterium]
MVDYLNGLQPQTALAVLGRAPKPTTSQQVPAASGGGESRNDAHAPPHGRTPPPPLIEPHDRPTGPPPAFEANLLEVEAKARRENPRLSDDDGEAHADARQSGGPQSPARQKWQGPDMPDPALIDYHA